jgi:Tol biopolymer transport system component
MGSTRKPFPRLGKHVLFGIGCAALSWVVLLAALQAGLRLRLEEYLSPLARAASLDYLLGEGGLFGALREGFVADALGLVPPSAPGPQGSDTASVAAGSATGGVTQQTAVHHGRPVRTVVEEPLDNDRFDKAYPVTKIPFTAKTETKDAGREDTGEPVSCDLSGGTVWFRFQPDQDLGLVTSTFGTSYSTALGVFTGSSLSDLTQVGCDIDTAGDAQVVFKGQAGQTYYFQVAAPAGGGHLEFSLDPLGTTEVVSLDNEGNAAADYTEYGSVSANGRYVAFMSFSDLVKEDTNWCQLQDHRCPDVFVRDTFTDRTVRVSVSSEGRQATGEDLTGGGSWSAAISGSGRFVAFASAAPNLVDDDHNRAVDVFVHDRDHDEDGRFDEHQPGALRTERVSLSSSGREGTASDTAHQSCRASPSSACWASITGNDSVSISRDGRYVAFSSDLQGLVGGVEPCTDVGGRHSDALVTDLVPPVAHVHGADTGVFSCRQVYVRDTLKDETFLASASSAGEPGSGDSSSAYVSRNGRWVVFGSSAPDLAPVVDDRGHERPDSNATRDVFIHDNRTHRTELVSVNSREEQGNSESGGLSIRGHVTVSNDGRRVAFISQASNMSDEENDPLYDVFLRDRKRGTTELVSKGADEPISHASITADGRYVAITSGPLESDPDRAQLMVIVWDRKTDTETPVSVSPSGDAPDGLGSGEPEITGNGRFVVFMSDATNLDDDHPTGGAMSIFIHELPWIR